MDFTTVAVACSASSSTRLSNRWAASPASRGRARREVMSMSGPGAGAVDGVALFPEPGGEVLGVGAVTRLYRQHHFHPLHGDGLPGAVVLDVQDVGARVGQDPEQAVELARPVVEQCAEVEVAPGRGQAVAHETE